MQAYAFFMSSPESTKTYTDHTVPVTPARYYFGGLDSLVGLRFLIEIQSPHTVSEDITHTHTHTHTHTRLYTEYLYTHTHTHTHTHTYIFECTMHKMQTTNTISSMEYDISPCCNCSQMHPINHIARYPY